MESDPRYQWFQKNSERQGAEGFSGQLLWDEPLSRHTYYRIGGPARLLAIPRSLDDLIWLAKGLRESGVSHIVLGAGSNVLASDTGYSGIVIKSSKLNLNLSVVGPGRIQAGASVAISTLLRRAAQEGWGGLEFLTGVPGSIGGAVAMNAGTHLGETRDRLRQVEAFTFEESGLKVFEGAALTYGYRENLFLPAGAVVYSTQWEYLGQSPTEVKSLIDETLSRRKRTQPIDFPSCGSVFKNPKQAGMHAWQVIERLGLRGRRIGDAELSSKHCNFIINHGQASAADVYGLIQLAKARAREELGIELEEEVKYVGEFPPTPQCKE